jgi:tetratricopeptide (TPR) repeat protein
MAQQFTDEKGQVDFVVDLSHPPFDFHVRASGKDIEETTSDLIHFDSNMERGSTKIVYLHVKSTNEPAPQSRQSVTSVTQSQAPKAARSALHDGLTAWEKQNYPQAAESFEKATALYPQYDEAFNYLGMVYAHLNQPEKSRAAFETAVKLNDKNASADRNLAGMVIRDRDYARAKDLAQKSLAVDPNNDVALTILAIAELQTGNYDEALRYARQAHTTPHDGYALCHFIAGQALERKHDTTEAQVEYKVYLAETPNGPEADKVKQALQRVSLSTSP